MHDSISAGKAQGKGSISKTCRESTKGLKNSNSATRIAFMRYTFGVPTALWAAIFAACVLALRAEDAKSHWAFQPLRNDTIPAVRDPSWPRNPIDQFVVTRLEEKGI